MSGELSESESAADPDSLVTTDVQPTNTERTDRPSEQVIETENLDVYYGDEQALDDVTMAVPENRVTALIGPSGCGKSTFLRCINRMNDLIDAARVEGTVALRGTDVDEVVHPVDTPEER